MNLKTIKDIKNLKNKTIILRLDLNVPIKNKQIQDDTRIQKSIKTIKHLIDKDAKIVIITHLGRPKGKITEDLRTSPIAKRLSKLLKHPVKLLNEIYSKKVKSEISAMKEKDIIMLENIRFDKQEKENNIEFSKQLASLGDIYINDAFGTTHRKHASVEGITHHIDSYAGLLIEEEFQKMSNFRNSNKEDTTLIIGGAKIKTKIGIITSFIGKADNILIGGALANTFIKAKGFKIGTSLYEPDEIEMANIIIEKAKNSKTNLLIPIDTITATEISKTAITKEKDISDIANNENILDIGPKTQEMYKKVIQGSRNIIWNGPVGLSEYPPFKSGTKTIATAISTSKNTSIIGGGDTIEAINKLKLPHSTFTHVSTGGGATLEFLSGKNMPGLISLFKH